MSKQKVTLRIEEGEVELLKEKFKTDNQSEAIRLAILQSLVTEDLEKVKTLFPYVGKKPPRIGREVVNAFEQSECKIFVDLFCGSIAMLCYLPWDVRVMHGGERHQFKFLFFPIVVSIVFFLLEWLFIQSLQFLPEILIKLFQ